MSSEGITLVRDGKPTATIVAPANGALAYAAQVIQRYVERMSGAKLPVVTDKQQVKGTHIVVRFREGAAKLDGFHIRTSDGEVVIEAAVPRGCIYGAYAFLEELGCRFYGNEPLGIVVPKRSTLTVARGLDVLREPSFAFRLPSTGTPEDHLRWGFNFTFVARAPEQEQFIRQLDLKQYSWGHIWPELVEKQFFADGREPQRMDYTGREDWLPADEKGVRNYNGQTLCFSNPQALEWFTENASNWVLTYCRNADYVSMWSADTWRIALCRCERCQAKGWNATDWYLLVHNGVWRKLKERGWKGVFGWIVYHGSEEPPQKVDLLENGREMDFLYAPRPRGASQHGPFTNDHPTNVRYRENLSAWREYLGQQNYQGTRTVFEYYYDLVLLGPLAAGRTWLIPKHTDMQVEMGFYLDQGFDGFFDCDPPSGVWFPDPLSRWLYHRLLWDVNLDIEAARRDFFEHYYGAAAEKIKRVREEVERLMFEPPSETVVGQLRALDTEFDAVLSQVGDEEALQRRIQAMRLWVRYCALCKESEFHEKVTQDAEKGRTAELAIRQLLTDNKNFLISNGLMTEGDLNYVANNVVNRHLRLFERLAGK